MRTIEKKKQIKGQKTVRSLYYYILVIILIGTQPISAKPTSSVLNVTLEWIIQSDSIIDQASVDVFVPSNTSNQRILEMSFSDPAVITVDGSTWKAYFNVSGIRAKKISGNFLIETDYVNRVQTNDFSEKYLEESEHVRISDEIRKLADTFNETFPNDIIKMNEWVHNNIKYNLTYTDVTVSDIVDVTLPSDWVLENKVGVCDELSTLFIALSRAKNIPARIVVGYVFRDGQWIPHAWAEAYVPKYGWIEIDPTWNEFLNLNALRFRTGTGADVSETTDRINATAKKNATVHFQSNTFISILNSTENEDVDIDVKFPPQFPTSEVQPVRIRAKNNVAAPIFITASIVPPIGTECTSCKTQIFLEPNEEKTNEFSLRLPTLGINVKYTFPVTIVTDYGRKNVSFERLIISEAPEDIYKSVEDLPLNFKLFVGLFMIGAVSLVIILMLTRI